MPSPQGDGTLSVEEHPSIIIVSQEVPHAKAAGSILLLRLLEHWPADRIQVFGPLPPQGAATLDCVYTEFRPLISRLQYTRFAPLAPPLAAVLPATPLKIAANKPAIVLSVMQTSMYYRAAYAAARHLGLPFGLIIHDDPEEIEVLRRWGLPTMRRLNGRIYRNADVRFCVSPQLRDLLAARYGASADVLYPNRSASLAPRPVEWNRSLRGERLTIGYAGTMNYGYAARLKELAPIFYAADVTLRIYSLQQREFLAAPGVEYAGASEQPDIVWERVKAECDAVILPYCRPQDGHQQLYRTHFPSKLPEYLALGMPVIVTGPSYATGVQWAAKNPDACIRVDLDEDAKWADLLSQLAADAVLRSTLALRALDAARRFDPREISAKFEAQIFSAVCGSNRAKTQ
jgi:glycosyltransferase involved in cell wall biosynthesis